MKIIASVTRFLAMLLVAFGCAVSAVSAADLAEPLTLVATQRLAGSQFGETVLFAAPLSNGVHVGFIVNRPTDVPLAAAFPEHPASREVLDPLYFGGPILPGMVFAVVHTPPQGSNERLQLMPGVLMVVDGEAIDRIINTMPNDARYFAGLTVWQPGELDEQIRAGAWEVRPADADAVFSTHPETLWQTLSRAGGRLEARAFTR